MNCVIYLRVSTKEQAEKADSKEGYSIPAQREACIKYAKEKGWNVIDEYTDRGESARSSNRPQLQEMLSRMKKQKDVEVVVVHKIDRLARNMEDHVTIKAVLKRAGAFLVSVVENIDDSASGRLVEGMHALMAEFYSSNLAMETKKGMIQKTKQGGWPQMAPLGYKNIQTPMHGRLLRTIEVDHERAPFIKRAFELYATGDYSLTELTEELYDMGLRSKGHARFSGKVSKSRIAHILQNQFYKGVVRWDNIESNGIHEPLVPSEIFNAVQDILRIRNQSCEKKRKHPHYLRGTLYCSCGSRMSSLMAKKQFLYFYCLGQKRHNGCKEKYVLASDIEKELELNYKKIQLSEDVIDKLKRDFNKDLLKREYSTIKEQEFLTKRMSKLVEQKSMAMDALYRGAIDMELLQKEQTRIGKELETCQSRLEVLKYGDDAVKENLDIALKMASQCFEGYTKGSEKTKKLFNQLFFKKVVIENKKVSELHYTDFYAYLFDPSSNKDEMVAGTGFEPATFGL